MLALQCFLQLCIVIVLPFFPDKLRGMLNNARIQQRHILNLMDHQAESDNLLLTSKYGEYAPPVNATRLWKALHFMEQNIPKELGVPMRRETFKRAKTQSDPQYFIIALTRINRQLLEFAVDSNRNLMLIRKMQDIVRVIQRRHPRARIRDLDWMLPMKQEIGSKVLEFWLRANDPKIFDQRHYIHVLWRWNGPSKYFNCVHSRSGVPFDGGEQSVFYYRVYFNACDCIRCCYDHISFWYVIPSDGCCHAVKEDKILICRFERIQQYKNGSMDHCGRESM